MIKDSNVLAIGSHPDDLEMFCAGTLLKLKDRGNKIYSLVCTDGGGKEGDRLKENKNACDFLGIEKSFVLDFKDSYLKHNQKLVNAIDKIVKEVKPKWVFTHSVDDYHQDHIAVAKATRSVNREQDMTLITYPSYNLTIPFDANMVVDITNYFSEKMELLEIFKSQKDEWYMQPTTIKARSLGINMAHYTEKFKIELMRF